LEDQDLSTLFDLLPIGAYRCRPDGTVLRVNAALCTMHGCASEAELIAAYLQRASSAYVEAVQRQRFTDILNETGSVSNFVSEMVGLKTGEPMWVREHAHLVRNAQGEPIYFEGTIEDITPERVATLKLQNSETLLRTVLQTIPDRIWLKDIHGVYLACNEAFAAGFGVDVEAVIGTVDHHWESQEMVHRILEGDRIAMHAGQSVVTEENMNAPDNLIESYYEIVKTPMRDANGNIVGLVGIARDIQRRKTSEMLLRDTTEQLELALISADLGCWNHDLTVEKGYFLDERSCAMLGRPTTDSRLGRAWGHLIHPDDLQATLDAMRTHLSGAANAYEAEYRARHSDGHWVWMSNRGKVVQFGKYGKPLRMVGTLMNVSKSKLAEQAIAHLAFHDALTGLPNRRLLADRLDLAILGSTRGNNHGGLLFIDLDKFKELNDQRGHDAGDLLLQEVARRLQQCIRAIDTVARLGGDEFVVLIQSLSADRLDAELHAAAVGHKILASLNEPCDLMGHVHSITPSIGVTLFLGADQSAVDILKRADLAMYEAKARGRNTMCFYDEIASAPANPLI